MKKIIFLLSLLLSINVMAQKQDSEDQYIFYEDETIKSILSYNAQTINAAMSAPSSALSSVGKWYAMYRGSDDYGTYYNVKKWRYTIYRPDGTGTFNKEAFDDTNYKYVKRIDSQKSYPITWKKTGDRIRIVYDIKRMTWKSTKQNQLAKLTAAERQDWQNILNRAQSNTRAKRMDPEENRVIRIDRDFVLVDSDGDFVGDVSESGLQKLMKARQDAEARKKRQEDIKQWQINNEKMLLLNSVSSCPDSNHPHAIDLGIGTKWACCNVGATSLDEIGVEYKWGDPTGKEQYPYLVRDEFVDIGTNIAGTTFDVAHVKWGGGWHMPSKREVEELIDKCKTVKIDNPAIGIYGIRYIGPNGNSIFFTGRYDSYSSNIWTEFFTSEEVWGNNRYAYTFYHSIPSGIRSNQGQIKQKKRDDNCLIRPVL